MNEDMEKMLQEAPAPTLTLEPFAEEKEEPAVVEKEEAVQPVDEKEKIKAILTPQEQKQVDAFVKQIDITNSQMVLQYGASSQKKIADFSESAGQRPDKGSWRDRQRADRRCERIKEHRGW